MSGSALTKNGEQNEADLELDIEEMRVQLGIVALEEEIAALREILSEWLTYFNAIDMTVQELTGERTVTERLAMNVRPGGNIDLTRHRPAIPANLVKKAPSQVAKKK